LRILIDRLAEKIGSGLVILGSTFQNKAILMVKTTADLGTRYPAGDLVKKISAHFGGKGGGSKNFAQAGGGKVERIPSALAAVEKEIANR
jgi:alanyl-tRNA synthetase